MSETTELIRPSRRSLLRMAAATTVSLAVPGTATAFAKSVRTSASPALSGPLHSAGAMSFGPGNVLFVGDIRAAEVHAFVIPDADITPQTDVALGNFHNFEGNTLVTEVEQKLAAMLGTTFDQIVINDMVIHQPSQQIFLSVERGRGPDAMPLIAKVNHGQLELLHLDHITHTKTSIPNEPNDTAMMEFYKQRSFAITDVKYHQGEIFVTGVSNQRFASTLHRIAYPFNNTSSTSTVEIWHPVHAEFETRAPIIRQLIKELNGETYLFAVYGCTPLVRFPLAALKDGAHVRGDVIGELGYGSNPIDMVTFTNPFDQKEYLVVTIDVRSAGRIAVTDLATAPAEPANVPIDFGPGGLGKTMGLLPIVAEHFGILDSRWAVQAERHPKTSYRLDISATALPYCFERKDGMSEMNFPEGPDPFEYRTHRNGATR